MLQLDKLLTRNSEELQCTEGTTPAPEEQSELKENNMPVQLNVQREPPTPAGMVATEAATDASTSMDCADQPARLPTPPPPTVAALTAAAPSAAAAPACKAGSGAAVGVPNGLLPAAAGLTGAVIQSGASGLGRDQGHQHLKEVGTTYLVLALWLSQGLCN